MRSLARRVLSKENGIENSLDADTVKAAFTLCHVIDGGDGVVQQREAAAHIFDVFYIFRRRFVRNAAAVETEQNSGIVMLRAAGEQGCLLYTSHPHRLFLRRLPTDFKQRMREFFLLFHLLRRGPCAAHRLQRVIHSLSLIHILRSHSRVSSLPLSNFRSKRRTPVYRLSLIHIWASEIEPFPILVSKIRFPRMEQMGDITKPVSYTHLWWIPSERTKTAWQ